MKAFDTDVLTEILLGNTAYVQRAEAVPVDQQAVPIIAIEEVLRGRFAVIRQAEAGKAPITIDRAYELFEQTLDDIRQVTILAYSAQAEIQFQEWRKQNRGRPKGQRGHLSSFFGNRPEKG